jgi:hypothetical protein
MDRVERLHEFIARLSQATAAASGEEAFKLVWDILNGVEDEFSGVPYFPDRWKNDGRMYPPQEDSRRSTNTPRVLRYRQKMHNTFIGENGAIKIEKIGKSGTVVVDKPGQDGRKVDEL